MKRSGEAEKRSGGLEPTSEVRAAKSEPSVTESIVGIVNPLLHAKESPTQVATVTARLMFGSARLTIPEAAGASSSSSSSSAAAAPLLTPVAL